MKKVTLLGDSIRQGYQETVTMELSEFADVWAPDSNCMHSVHHLFNLSWYIEQPADLIHFNFGLWDCRRLGADRAINAVPVELFARNLDFILEKVRASTTATLIWATITPIVESRYNIRFNHSYGPCRIEADVRRYNEAAAPVLAKHSVRINDLYAFVTNAGAETLICEDGVHNTPEGCTLLGRRVAAEIRNALES